jgi:hypothetical protein
VADAEALGKRLRDQVLACEQMSLENIGEERLHNGQSAQAVVALKRFAGGYG